MKKIKKQNKSASSIPLVQYQGVDSFGKMLGYQLKKMDRKNQKAIVLLALRQDHLSMTGRVHGGVISAFFDFACGAAVFSSMSDDEFCSTVELKVNYFKPLHLGDLLECRSRVVFRGKRLCVVHAELFKKGQKAPVAMATATFNVVTKK